MADDSSGQAFLIGFLLTTLVLGILVLVVKPNYRVAENLISNEDYYPHIEVQIKTE
ncbi:hypothetical protein HYY75_10010 [bacterium]|nr:hypothetical protein [bacterium]